MPVNATPDIATLPLIEECHRFILVKITAPAAPKSGNRPAVNLALVLDRSGSMDGSKMRSAIIAAKSAIDRLTDRDRFSVVTFDDSVQVVVPSTVAKSRARRQACSLIDSIEAGGSTDLSTGWLTGCGQVADHLSADMVGRVLLLTDGQANRGIQSVEALREHAAELHARGVATTTFGIGTDFNEVLLRKIAEAGGGNFYFIETPQQIEDCITSETGEALEVTARDASLVVRVPAGVQLRCRSGHATRETDGALHVSLGSLVSEQEIALVLEARIPAGSEPCVLLMRMADADGRMADDTAQVELQRSSEPAGRPNADVVKALVVAMADKGRLKALEASQHGDFNSARRHLQGAIDRIVPYHDLVAEAAELIEQLRNETDRFSRMSSFDRKKMYMSSSARSVSRREGGYSSRRARDVVALLSPSPDVLRATDAAEWICQTVMSRGLFLDRVHGPRGEINASTEGSWVFRIADKMHHVPLRIAVIDAPLHDGEYAHWHADNRTAVVSTHGVAPHLLEAFLAYKVLLHGLLLGSYQHGPDALWHDEARGCLFDRCRNRANLAVRLQVMDICPTCAQTLDSCHFDVSAVRAACAKVREACVSPRT